MGKGESRLSSNKVWYWDINSAFKITDSHESAPWKKCVPNP